MPPSVNELYNSGKFNGQSRRWKSESYNLFLTRAGSWQMPRHKLIKETKAYFQSMIEQGYMIKVDMYFAFLHERIWTKEKKNKPTKPKKLDPSNFLKAPHDVISQMIEIDDCHFFTGVFEKCETTNNKEFVTIIFTPHKPRNIDEIHHAYSIETCSNQITR